jgi:hypothetical protein
MTGENIRIRKTRQKLEWQLQEIQKRISTEYNDNETMKDLGRRPLLFYYYKNKNIVSEPFLYQKLNLNQLKRSSSLSVNT